ncbi:MAG: cytochrome c, partial [Robiginitalea sp.]
MKKVFNRHQLSTFFGFCLVITFLFSPSLIAQEETVADQAAETEAVAGEEGPCGPGDPVKGKQLFNQNCAACHALNRKMTGPALANVASRLIEEEGLDCEWISSWIKNSSGMISSGDSYSNRIYEEYNQAAMTAFPTLSDQDINDILAYTEAEPPAPVAAATAAGA